MDYNRAKEEIINRWEEIISQITSPAKERVNGHTSYICPLCGHGTHGDGLAVNPRSKDRKGLKCFGSCNFSGDIIDLIGEVENITDYPEKLKRAGEYIGITIEGRSTPEEDFSPASKPAQNQPKNEQYTHMDIHTNTYTPKDAEADYMSYYKECQPKQLEKDYHTQRGISWEVANRFMLGYDYKYRAYNKERGRWEEWVALIIPTGRYSYVARNTDPEATKGNRYRKTGEATPLNWKALQNATKPIFITEGEIDALSIIEVGGEAIGLGSLANANRFISNYVKKHRPEQPLVIALDNEEDPQKQKKVEEATATLEKGLEELGVVYYVYNPAGEHKDANEALTADREAFAQAVARAEHIEKEALEAEREEYIATSSYNHLQGFINGIADSVNTPATPTGFNKLDTALDGGLYEGLYVIGAISSLGKTTLALQIADQIADSGRDVLIFSLEMARAELMSKSISRLTLLDILETGGNIKNAKTNRGITAGARYEHYSQTERDLIQRSISSYGKYAPHIFIHEGIGNIGVEYIRNTVRKHIHYTDVAPVVLIDYLQILAPPETGRSLTDKQVTDKNVLELKRISRDYKIPVIGISSFNRDNYTAPVNLSSFKESGAIEYSSDVLIGLQYEGMDYRDGETDGNRQKRIRTLLKDMKTRGKNGEVQDIQLKILKNRNGATGDSFLEYYPLFNYFEEK